MADYIAQCFDGGLRHGSSSNNVTSSRLREKVYQVNGMLLKRGMGNGEWGMGNGQWGMGNGEWEMGNGEWGMGNGKWGMGMGNGKLKMGNGKLKMGN